MTGSFLLLEKTRRVWLWSLVTSLDAPFQDTDSSQAPKTVGPFDDIGKTSEILKALAPLLWIVISPRTPWHIWTSYLRAPQTAEQQEPETASCLQTSREKRAAVSLCPVICVPQSLSGWATVSGATSFLSSHFNHMGERETQVHPHLHSQMRSSQSQNVPVNTPTSPSGRELPEGGNNDSSTGAIGPFGSKWLVICLVHVGHS